MALLASCDCRCCLAAYFSAVFIIIFGWCLGWHTWFCPLFLSTVYFSAAFIIFVGGCSLWSRLGTPSCRMFCTSHVWNTGNDDILIVIKEKTASAWRGVQLNSTMMALMPRCKFMSWGFAVVAEKAATVWVDHFCSLLSCGVLWMFLSWLSVQKRWYQIFGYALKALVNFLRTKCTS